MLVEKLGPQHQRAGQGVAYHKEDLGGGSTEELPQLYDMLDGQWAAIGVP